MPGAGPHRDPRWRGALELAVAYEVEALAQDPLLNKLVQASGHTAAAAAAADKAGPKRVSICVTRTKKRRQQDRRRRRRRRQLTQDILAVLGRRQRRGQPCNGGSDGADRRRDLRKRSRRQSRVGHGQSRPEMTVTMRKARSGAVAITQYRSWPWRIWVTGCVAGTADVMTYQYWPVRWSRRGMAVMRTGHEHRGWPPPRASAAIRGPWDWPAWAGIHSRPSAAAPRGSRS